MSAVFDVAREAGRPHRRPARLELLFDPGTFRPVRSAVGDGVLSGSGRVNGRPVYAWAQDGGFKGGSLGAARRRDDRPHHRAGRQARRAGRRLPALGRRAAAGGRRRRCTPTRAIFRAQALARVPQISVIGGPCAGGAAYSPALGDLTVMAGPRRAMFLTGPAVVERVTREQVTAMSSAARRCTARTASRTSSPTTTCTRPSIVRAALAHLPSQGGRRAAAATRRATRRRATPARSCPSASAQVYDVRDVIARIVDAGELLELGPRWARNLVVGFARIEGSPVGVIANQPHHLGGCLDADVLAEGRLVRRPVRPLRPAARRPRRHARLPARRGAGAGRRHPPRRLAAAGVQRRHRRRA